MSEAIPVKVGDTTVFIEMEEAYGTELTSAEQVLRGAEDAFNRAKETILTVSSNIVEGIKKLDNAVTPSQFTLEFGVKFRVDGTVMLASAGTEATLKVTMIYKHDKSG